jgi:AcrR family transcriptional regulator
MPVNDASVTGTARRAQIVAATIDTIADLGYRQASFTRIAERAGLSSTRLISYHFAGKDDLIGAVTGRVYAELGAFMGERMRGKAAGREALATYIRSLVEFIADHPGPMQALMSVFLEHHFEEDGVEEDTAQGTDADPQSGKDGGKDGSRSYDADTDRRARARAPLEDLLSAGQRSGEFRDFDVFVMAGTIQRALDGLPYLLRSAPGLDLGTYADELATMFDLATKRSP